MASSSSRRMRGFKRWMRWQGIECSDALEMVETIAEDGDAADIRVRALCDLEEGDLVATIPKASCLTVKSSAACRAIEEFGLEGYMALSVALMYERSLGQHSPWFAYLHLLPDSEPIPLLWSLPDLDSFLAGTELHKIVKQDKALVLDDWKACILPFLDTPAAIELKLNPDDFGVQHYFAAKSLIASRSFQIDDYYGFGMVPLADLFNHKTGAEDVHFTAVSSHSDSECENMEDEDDNDNAGDPLQQNDGSSKSCVGGNDMSSSTMEEDSAVLQMIMVKRVAAGSEVFNTYGYLGNAALLHRYGFTEPDNPYDIVNIDVDLVLEWSSSLYSARYSRSRVSLWRKLEYCGCISQNSEYFEISYDGEPQVELLVLLYIILLPDEVYNEIYLRLSTGRDLDKTLAVTLAKKKKESIVLGEITEKSKNLLLTESVRRGLVSLADIRERCYGSRSLEDDMEALKACCHKRDRKRYHSLMLRISERNILEKLRTYASSGGRMLRSCERATVSKKKAAK